jgi:hypothetical protein
MMSFHVGNMLPPNQLARWYRALGTLRSIEARDREDPYVFHGTTSLSAAHIMRDGFNPSFIRAQPLEGPTMTAPPYPLSCNGVHWGSVNVATWAVDKGIRADDRPVILYARASDVLRSGIAVPDWMAIEHSMGSPYDSPGLGHQGDVPCDADWRLSLESAGAFGVIDGRHVANLRVFDPLARMPVHPGWARAREERLNPDTGGFMLPQIQPPPGHVEPTPKTHPPTWTERDALIAVWGEEFVRRGEMPREAEANDPMDARAPGM